MDTIVKTCLFGIGGLIVGGMYKITTPVDASEPSILFSDMGYVYIQMDKQLCNVLVEIHQIFIDIDHVAYIRTLKSIDQIIALHQKLLTRGYTPNMQDRVAGIGYFRRTKESIQRFITRAETIRDPREVIYVQRHVKQLMTLLENHMRTIIVSTRDIYTNL